MKFIANITAIIGALLLVGCAHPISMAPKMSALESRSASQIVPKNVGYYVSEEDRAREVTTPGGGGDKVSYFPYKDLEPGLYKVLSNNFKEVYQIKSLDDKNYIAQKNIAYVFIPKIETTSSSNSAFTWPPTDFSVSLDCRTVAPTGAVVWQTKAKGEGKASFSEFKHDFSLAARLASERALLQLQEQIRTSPIAK